MSISEILNLVGLIVVTAGALGCAKASPSPLYGPDGTVALVGEPHPSKRKSIHKWQRHFSTFLYAIAFGAALQIAALSLSLKSGH